MSVQCGTATHAGYPLPPPTYWSFALVMALLYSVGTPLLYFALLWPARKGIRPETGSDIVDLFARDCNPRVRQVKFLFGEPAR